MYLSAIVPQTTIKDVKEIIPWDLKTAEDLGEEIKEIEPPTKEQLKFMREFEPFLGISGHEGRILQVRSLPGYYAKHKDEK